MIISRRKFLARTAIVTATGTVARLSAAPNPSTEERYKPLVISTWPFGKAANDVAIKVIEEGRSPLDAVEEGISVVEADRSNPSVGLGGRPNSASEVQLDACIMFGPGHKGGSVGALEGIAHPISVARRIMEITPHVMLVGEGAHQFALAQGFGAEAPGKSGSKTPQSKSADSKNHDTIALLALGRDGTIAGGCSTSGLAGKLPGRVGDSALVGCGTYADSTLGGVSCTGDGEAIIRVVLARRALEYLKEADDPDYAAKVAVDLLVEEGRGEGGLIVVDWRGRIGSAHSTALMPVGWMSPTLSEPALSF